MLEEIKHKLLIHGTVLFLLGLLNGVAVPFFINRRMGLSAHLAGVQNAIVFWIFGFLSPYMNLTQKIMLYFYWLAIFGMYSIWVGLLFAAIWGTSQATPIAGAGYSGTTFQEAAVEILFASGSATLILATVLLLFGLVKRK